MLLALRTSDGGEAWVVPLDKAMIGHGGSLDGVIASPAISDGTAYAISPGGIALAVELATGKERWRLNLGQGDSEPIEPPYYGFASSPLVVDDLVLFQIGGEAGVVTALERDSGKVAWRAFPGPIDSQSPKLIEVNGRKQVVFASNEWVGGLDPEEGTVLWRWPFEGRSAFVLSTSPMAVGDSRIFFTPSDDYSVVLQPPTGSTASAAATASSDSGVDFPAPEVVWQGNALTKTYSPATVVGDTLVGYTSRLLSAYSADTGERLWRSRAPGDGFLIAVDEQLVVITKSGSLHLANIDGGWSEVATSELFENIVWTTPSYSQSLDAVFVRSMTEIARVDLVRSGVNDGVATPVRISDAAVGAGGDGGTASAGQGDLPPQLAALLAADVQTTADRVTAFLAANETPIIDGKRALFLWRGDATDVGIAGDFLGMRREEPLQRLAGTDLWWFQAEVEARLQYAYFLMIDVEPIVDPLNPHTDFNTVWGYNTNWVRGKPVEVSVFSTPGWPGPAAHFVDPPKPVRSGSSATVTVPQPDGADERLQRALSEPFDVWLPPDYETSTDRLYPTVYVMEWAGLRDPRVGRWIETLNATADRDFEAPIVVFIDGGLPRPDAFSMKTVTDAVDGAFRTRTDAASRALVSMGFRGVEPPARASAEPELIGKFGVQGFLGFDEEVEGALAGLAIGGSTNMVGYVEWGSLGTRSPSEGWDMREAARQVYEGLTARGVTMHGGMVESTGDFKSWRNRTHLMLGALFPVAED